MSSSSNGYGTGPCYPELAAIVLIGTLHVATELGASAAAARIYNVAVSLAMLGYLAWRFMKSENVARIWGMRRDNFWSALRAQSIFGAIATVGFLVLGFIVGTLPLPATFWITLAVYPIWGIAQQFALQNLIARNLAGPMRNPVAIAVTASVLFAASHYPRLELVALTFGAGIFFTLIYRRFPNLWAVGIVHGLLGSLAFYVVLGEDPGAAMLSYL